MSSERRITRSSKIAGEMDLNKSTPPSNQEAKVENSSRNKKRGRKKGKKVISPDINITTPTIPPSKSPHVGGRVLRSASKKSEMQNPNSVEKQSRTVTDTTPVQEKVPKRENRGRKPSKSTKPSTTTELSTIRNRVRSLVSRINFEQNLIDAYSTDGWKGQSLEKIRPEKELERAKAQIIKCKLKIRDSFKQLESLLSEGKLDNFDSKGEIDCDDIFCAKCKLKNETLNNDIILCDGICERGFHQNCLNPPLLTKDIPPGDAGWLCPACDCKVDCVELLNDSHGSKLVLGDSWERVFPEAVAAANGGVQCDLTDFPSDDSEDDDFDPDKNYGEENGDDNGDDNGDEDHEGGESGSEEDDESSTDDSDLYTESDEDKKMASKKAKSEKKGIDIIDSLPSEDSEDEDFCDKGNSDADDSDFSSDSDDFCNEIMKKSGGRDRTGEEMESGDAPVKGRRKQQGPLDYKKLYQETFGKETAESSEDEAWTETKRKKKGKALETSSNNSPKSSPLTKSNSKFFGLDKNKTLKEYFETNQYPSRESKEILAEELGLTYRQVHRWFENSRRLAKHNTSTPNPQNSTSPKKRGKYVKKSMNKIADNLSKCNTTANNNNDNNNNNNDAILAEPVTPISRAKLDKSSPPHANPSPSKSPMEFMNDERKKAIMRELRKQKMGR